MGPTRDQLTGYRMGSIAQNTLNPPTGVTSFSGPYCMLHCQSTPTGRLALTQASSTADSCLRCEMVSPALGAVL